MQKIAPSFDKYTDQLEFRSRAWRSVVKTRKTNFMLSYNFLKRKPVKNCSVNKISLQNEALRRKPWGWRKYHLFRPTSTFWTAWSCNRVRMYQELCVSIFFSYFLIKYTTIWRIFWCKICSVVLCKSPAIFYVKLLS